MFDLEISILLFVISLSQIVPFRLYTSTISLINSIKGFRPNNLYNNVFFENTVLRKLLRDATFLQYSSCVSTHIYGFLY